MTKKERIEKLLDELRYEIEIGMMQGEIEETMTFNFIVPVSKDILNGVVVCKFYTRPMHRQNAISHSYDKPRLEVIKGSKL